LGLLFYNNLLALPFMLASLLLSGIIFNKHSTPRRMSLEKKNVESYQSWDFFFVWGCGIICTYLMQHTPNPTHKKESYATHTQAHTQTVQMIPPPHPKRNPTNDDSALLFLFINGGKKTGELPLVMQYKFLHTLDFQVFFLVSAMQAFFFSVVTPLSLKRIHISCREFSVITPRTASSYRRCKHCPFSSSVTKF